MSFGVDGHSFWVLECSAFEPRGLEPWVDVHDASLEQSCGSFRKFGVPYVGVLMIRSLLFRVLYQGSPIFGSSHVLKREVVQLSLERYSMFRPEISARNFRATKNCSPCAVLCRNPANPEA